MPDNSTSQLRSPEAQAKAKATREAKKALGLPTLRQAIDQHCRDCLYDSGCGGGSWRQQIEACTAPNCAIYPIRAVSKPKESIATDISGGIQPVSNAS